MLTPRQPHVGGRRFRRVFQTGPDDEVLTYLPLCHVAERLSSVINALGTGYVVNFGEGGESFAQDLRDVQPTLFAASRACGRRCWPPSRSGWPTPRGSSARRTGRPCATAARWRRSACAGASARATACAPRSPTRSPCARCATSSGWPAWSGAVCGAAPIAPQVLEYFWALGVPVYEIYGQTENTAVCTFMPVDDVRIGTVGKPLAGVELRIADDGEILTRSPAVFDGYFKDDEATAATIDPDGWLHTGDVGELDERRPPHDHRPQEGHHHHRGRQEHLAVGDREPAQGLAVRARGDGDRRPPQVPRRADRHRVRHGRRLGRAQGPARSPPTATSRARTRCAS